MKGAKIVLLPTIQGRSGSQPDDASAYRNRAIAFQSKRRLDKALADFGDVIRLRPVIRKAIRIGARPTATKAPMIVRFQTTARRSAFCPKAHRVTSAGSRITRKGKPTKHRRLHARSDRIQVMRMLITIAARPAQLRTYARNLTRQ